MKKAPTIKIVHEVLEQYEKKSEGQFFKDGLRNLSKFELIGSEDAKLLKKLAESKSVKQGLKILAELKKATKSRFVKAELIPGMIFALDRLETSSAGSGSNNASAQASTGAGTASIIIIGATGAGAAIGTAIGGPPAGTLIGAAVGMLVGGALAAGAVAADGDGGVSGGEGDGGDEAGGEGDGGGEGGDDG
jgi:hypothetical protein